MFERREDETLLENDPADLPPDGHVVFIGRIASPWTSREDCPKNMRAARETGRTAAILIDKPYLRGLQNLDRASHIVILSWLDHAPRNLIVQKPRHAAEPKGVFSLRSPARPNPVGLHIAKLVALDIEEGRIEIDAIDVLDGTPVVDIKPYYASTDAFPEAAIAGREEK
ncbi:MULTISPECIES: tRNA (N6-threonylcarbamoyladenosine(37)-N6)-methyltransferase TrmO [unclassified Mesorhizobium]|uniref:tRNA (N6-threonylcarbamoyladenosine(37)-N6)-methyltransferase TrmO n=1 Tax=unclassified Mesorhizobium TaxID=325217 RepID=UPI000FCC89F3|nr:MULTISPECIES: tRNA (N6-threonylcarbamoyladenosine(37)-N6)-methyltransferase TrmO [unclassified Mesorhizobium]RUW01276.1 tRNA (N6-threonylcarbamoyladenosine(37)-N6)-methyltransferase TrmO [Mesorhizobium sp. M1A.F.Ca.IN.020.04.1.1]RUW09195.1 tRNA (N6-threonylcarbamoyladenosine(37)-N6)-methyltransferase TrmO [Mesorhizobium sp. M1A.F.Ca.IN.020.03.1.1]RWF72808.1 MAG: tRNA (N6-threonylcarbamoyladenosine(37)-N6)-methyltransferase TrmO [Mesorhizobium sp.]RWG16603.1 MAG: tRNA (N6-threonylcarbamoylade